MKVVIQCAGAKKPDAGRLTRPTDGKAVTFVAHPERCQDATDCCRPDDMINACYGTWRAYLEVYNQNKLNPDKLCRAGELYRHPIYGELVNTYGWKDVFILSAGWGLVRSDYLIPYYDITFSPDGDPWSRRSQKDRFCDLNQLKDCITHEDKEVVFFGGGRYLPLYRKLTTGMSARKIIYIRVGAKIDVALEESYELRSYGTPRRTNWHYSCARDFINGKA